MIENENILKNPDRKYLKKGHRGFLPNNPGKPFGAICRSTRLKNEVLDILEMRKEELKTMSIDKLLSVGAMFVPKELKGEGFANGTYVYIVKDGKHTEGCDSNRIALHPASEPADDKG